jgi:hypothetical protein
MNFNHLDFLEIGLTIEPNMNICTKVKDDLHGFVIETNADYLNNLICSPAINKIYYNKSINLIDIFDIYNILSIKYLKIKCNDLNYSIILSLINRNRPINIDKFQFESNIKNDIYYEILNYLENNNYIYLDGKSDAFFMHRKNISNLICKPNFLDELFLYNLKYNLEYKG